MSDMTDEEVVVLGATNQPEKLDDALLRPGRFTEVIEVGLPDAEARKSILRVHLRDPPVVNDDINYESFVEATEGLSAAEIGEIADTAARLAIKESEEESLQAITQRHITDAISEIKETKSTKEEGGEYL
jgi:transitional endoplasmic reticulum ATPase